MKKWEVNIFAYGNSLCSTTDDNRQQSGFGSGGTQTWARTFGRLASMPSLWSCAVGALYGKTATVLRYVCCRGDLDNAEPRCIGTGGDPVDEAVSREMLKVVQVGSRRCH